MERGVHDAEIQTGIPAGVQPSAAGTPAYPPEFQQQMVELVRAGRRPEELSREFEPTAQTIHNWVKQADLDELEAE